MHDCIQTDNINACVDVLQALIEMAESHAKMMKPYLAVINQTMLNIMNNEVRVCVG